MPLDSVRVFIGRRTDQSEYDTDVQLAPGAQIGAYVLEELLGSGAFGVVWLGHHSQSGERVAIKILHPEAAENRENVERFKREAWALSNLQSAHIARMYEMVTGPGYEMALVMEYIEGELLSDVLKRARFSVEDAFGRVCVRRDGESGAVRLVHDCTQFLERVLR